MKQNHELLEYIQNNPLDHYFINIIKNLPSTLGIIRLQLSANDSVIRVVAINALKDDKESYPEIRKLLDDPDCHVRAEAAEVLAKDPESYSKIRTLLNDEESEVRYAAVRALTADYDSFSEICRIMEIPYEDTYVRIEALRALAIDYDYIDNIAGLLTAEDMLANEAILVLKVYPSKIHHVVTHLKTETREDVLINIIDFLEDKKEHFHALLPFIQCECAKIRSRVMRILAKDDTYSKYVEDCLKSEYFSLALDATAALLLAKKDIKGFHLEDLSESVLLRIIPELDWNDESVRKEVYKVANRNMLITSVVLDKVGDAPTQDAEPVLREIEENTKELDLKKRAVWLLYLLKKTI